MSETQFIARTTWRLIWAAVCLGLLCTGGVFLTLRADAQTQGDATIPDDPTVAPDPHESADNNVSFPADI